MLYRKYRPQSFSEVIGQAHVVRTLEGGLKNGRLGHAYLFTGPRGTGKTTIARIFAKALNCAEFGKKGGNLPCNKCEACLSVNTGQSLDLIEIDAASNRGIDEIRNLKESAMVAAPSGGYKVFLIDEVHMLTKDAFNALLKILEEPPSHVVFILATTEPHKILPTVLSRVQRFDFKRLTVNEILQKLRMITKSEHISIEEDGLKAIAVSADGAFRDAEVSLSKIISNGVTKITSEELVSMLGLIPINFHPKLLSYLMNNQKPEAIDFLNKIHESGVDMEHFSKDFLEYLRKVLIAKINPAILTAVGEDMKDESGKTINAFAQAIDTQKLIRMINVFTGARMQIKTSPIAQLPLELAVMEIIGD